MFTPEDYVPIFKKNNIDLVVRLNKKRYDKSRFTTNKIKHVDLYYIDGSTPKDVTYFTFYLTFQSQLLINF